MDLVNLQTRLLSSSLGFSASSSTMLIAFGPVLDVFYEFTGYLLGIVGEGVMSYRHVVVFCCQAL